MNKYVKIKITGKNNNYFIKKLINNNIRFYDLKIIDNSIFLKTSYNNYKKILKVKGIYNVDLCSYVGFYKYIYFIKKYWYLFLFYFIGVFFVIFLSNIIFDIEIVHENSNIRNIVREDLKLLGISKYKFKRNFSEKEEIINKILKKESDYIEWMEIIENGTKYVVKVEQRKKNNDTKQCNYGHIVAKKDSMISYVTADSGEIKVKRFDYVKKGDILISGLIHNKDEVVALKCARGKVLGEVWYIVNLEFPLYYSENVYTNNINYGFIFKYLNNSYPIFNKFKMYNESRKQLFNNYLSPIGIYFSKFYEVKQNINFYDINNIDFIAINKSIKCLKNKIDNNFKVIDKKVLKKEKKKSKIIVDVFIKVEEDITDFLTLSNSDISKYKNKKE